MTKQEFVDAVAAKSGLGKGEAAKAVDACSTRSRRRSGGAIR